MVRVQAKLEKAAKCLEYFSTQQWRFSDENVRHLNSMLSNEDRNTFMFDVRQINWTQYLESYVLGIRQFIFKEHPSSIPKTRKHLIKWVWKVTLDYCVLAVDITWNKCYHLNDCLQVALAPPFFTSLGSFPHVEGCNAALIRCSTFVVSPPRHNGPHGKNDPICLTRLEDLPCSASKVPALIKSDKKFSLRSKCLLLFQSMDLGILLEVIMLGKAIKA